jgi:hypothetical protein
MFDRFEAYKQAIQDRSIDFNTLGVMIDFHLMVGNFTETEAGELFELMQPQEIEEQFDEPTE